MLKLKKVHRLKTEFAKIKETALWKKLFVVQIDTEKMAKLKAEYMMKYGSHRNMF